MTQWEGPVTIEGPAGLLLIVNHSSSMVVVGRCLEDSIDEIEAGLMSKR